MQGFTGIDQHGRHYDDLGLFPRKELLNRLGYRKADKMYVDTKDGRSKHVGYVIGGNWITLYRVQAWEGRAL